MHHFFHKLEALDVPRCLFLSDKDSGLRAIVVLDSVALGPAAGGIRTRAYTDTDAAFQDCSRLARAMTLKCALAGLAAGGGKAVVMDHPGLDRQAAFAVLGKRIDELGGLFRTAGDLGTSRADLLTAAAHTKYVHTEEGELASGVARGLVRCVEACAEVHGHQGLHGLSVAIQGCGVIGSAVAHALHATGAKVRVADSDAARAALIRSSVGAAVVDSETILAEDVDILCPCAVGGVVTTEVASHTKAWAICGAANNIIASTEAENVLLARNVLHVPDTIASAGGVIEGIGRSVMGLADRRPLIDDLGTTAREVLEKARHGGIRPSDVAESLARQRMAAQADASSGREHFHL